MLLASVVRRAHLSLMKEIMNPIRAIGFDLFNTLITVEPQTLQEAHSRLFLSLTNGGFQLEEDAFRKAHRQAAMDHLAECQKTGEKPTTASGSAQLSRSRGTRFHLKIGELPLRLTVIFPPSLNTAI